MKDILLLCEDLFANESVDLNFSKAFKMNCLISKLERLLNPFKIDFYSKAVKSTRGKTVSYLLINIVLVPNAK